jgi:hypothetical protein
LDKLKSISNKNKLDDWRLFIFNNKKIPDKSTLIQYLKKVIYYYIDPESQDGEYSLIKL